MEDTINIKDMDKAEVLAKLYNASRPLGIGHLNPASREGLSVEQARELLGEALPQRGAHLL